MNTTKLKEISYDTDDEYSSDRPYGGWLDPNLKFHEVRYEGHRGWALHLLSKMKIPGYLSLDAQSVLYKMGFIRVVFSGNTMYYRNTSWKEPLPEPTQRQMKALKDLATEHDCKFLEDCETGKTITDFLQESILTEQVGLKFWWLGPHMNLHPVSFEQHRYWAEEYLKKIGRKVNVDLSDIYTMMYRLGFIRVVKQKWGNDTTLNYSYEKGTSINSKKLKALNDLAIEQQCEYLVDDTTGRETQLLEEIVLKCGINEEMSYDELLRLTTPERKEKSSNVTVRSLPVSTDGNQEQWNFRYKSSPQTTTTNKPFRGSIKFLKGSVGNNDDASKLKCEVDCECEDFMYRFAYNDASKGASHIGTDSLNGCLNRRPKPAYDYGEGLCKHLVALGKFLKTKIASTKKSNLFEAIGDVAKRGAFNVTYYD